MNWEQNGGGVGHAQPTSGLGILTYPTHQRKKRGNERGGGGIFAWKDRREDSIGRSAATRVHSNPGSSADQFDWEGRKINGNRKKTPRKCPFQGRNLKVTTPEEGRGKEKLQTCSVAVPSEVGFFGVQWRSSPHNLDQYRGKLQFSTLLADLRRHLNTIPHLRSLLQVSHDPNPRKKTPAEQYWRFPGAAKMLQLAKDFEIFHLTRHAKERKGRSSTSFSPPFELFLRQHRSSAVPRRLSPFFCRYGFAMTSNLVAVPRQQTCQLGSSMLSCLTLLAAVVDARRTVDLFSHFCHIVDDGNHRSTSTCGLFGLCLCFGSFAVDLLSALHPADIACEAGKFLRKLLLWVYDRPLPISLSDRSHPAFVEALSYVLTEKVP